MEQNIQDLDAVPWMLIIFVLLILLMVGTVGFFIGRGTAPKAVKEIISYCNTETIAKVCSSVGVSVNVATTTTEEAK